MSEEANLFKRIKHDLKESLGQAKTYLDIGQRKVAEGNAKVSL